MINNVVFSSSDNSYLKAVTLVSYFFEVSLCGIKESVARHMKRDEW